MKKSSLFLALAILITGCSSDNSNTNFKGQLVNIPIVADAPVLSRSEQEAMQSLDAVGCKIFNLSAEYYNATFNSEDKNILFSPLSASMAIAMLANCGDDILTDQITDALEFSDLENLNSACSKTLINLANFDDESTLSIANGIWYSAGLEVLPSFIDKMNNSYFAEVNSVEFGDKATAELINSWCSQKTNGLIKNIYEPQSDASAVLINALYYESKWESEFDKEATTDADFFGSDKTTKVRMMHKTIPMTYFYAELPSAKMLEFELKGRQNMVLILPDEGVDCIEYSKHFSFGEISNAPYEQAHVNLSLPKFSVEESMNLNSVLESLNIHLEVNKLEKMGLNAGGNITCTQRSNIATDEEGVIMASATKVEIIHNSAGTAPKTVDMNFNRPFIFLIKDYRTNSILMAGRVCNL